MLPVRELTEGLLLCARFDCTSATLVGVMGRARRAAAAAADDNDEVEVCRLRKTEAAAVAAFGFAVSLVKGYRDEETRTGQPNSAIMIYSVSSQREESAAR